MNQWTKGFAAGLGLMSLFWIGYAVGQSQQNGYEQIDAGLEQVGIANRCDVRVYTGFRTSSDRCFMNQVQTGYDGEYIYCSDFDVSCP